VIKNYITFLKKRNNSTMKIFKFFSIMFCTLLCAFSFSACGGDDNDNDGGGSIPTPTPDPTPTHSTYKDMIIGDWIVYYSDSYSEKKVEITFTTSGKYYAKDSWLYDDTWSEPFAYNGTYVINGNTINIIESNDKAYFAGKLTIVSMTANKFTLKDSDGTVFSGEKISSGNTGGGETISSSIVGTWKYTFSAGYEIITFNADGTGFLKEVDYEDGYSYTENFAYTYDEANKTLKITYHEDGNPYIDTMKVKSVSATMLIIENEEGIEMKLYRE